MTDLTPPPRAGFVAIIGAPNAGKSTLLNRLIGQKISIVSAKANTTRMRVLGLLTEGSAQIGLIDTPGIFAAATGSSAKLDDAMLRAAWDSLTDANLVLLMVDAATHQPDARTDAIIASLTAKKQRACLVLNKVDKVHPEKLLPMAQRLNDTGIFDEIFMVSALSGDGTEPLKKKLIDAMPVGPWFYPEDQLSDLPQRLLAAEMTREQLFRQLHDELPYAATVVPESWETKRDGSAIIRQTILVTRPGHRAIVLGKEGARIKALGQAAREEMAAEFGHPVHLFLTVQVDEKWQERSEFYRLFGLDEKGKKKR